MPRSPLVRTVPYLRPPWGFDLPGESYPLPRRARPLDRPLREHLVVQIDARDPEMMVSL